MIAINEEVPLPKDLQPGDILFIKSSWMDAYRFQGVHPLGLDSRLLETIVVLHVIILSPGMFLSHALVAVLDQNGNCLEILLDAFIDYKRLMSK